MTHAATSRFDAALSDYLLANKWFRERCDHCGRTYFSKWHRSCQSPWCPGSRPADPEVRGAAKPPRPPSMQWQRLRRALAGRGVPPSAMPDLKSAARDTDLVVSALQHLDPVVHDGAPAPVGPYVLAQPCVRWQYLPTAGREDGVSSSFVNLSSLEVGGPDLVERLAHHLDIWLDGLSALGIHARDVTIALTDEDCAYGPYEGRRADVNCAGVEIGELNWYYRVADAAERSLTVIDCGFSLERILSTATGVHGYHAALSPIYLAGVKDGGVVNDRVRTLALLSLFGVTPGSRGPRRYARRLADELAVSLLKGINLSGCLDHAAGYWRQFATPTAAPAAALATACEAVEQQAIARLSGALRIAVPPQRMAFAEVADFLAVRAGGWEGVSRAVETLAAEA
ncbi:hypothetical protein ACFVFQ_12445 [Streptomyces sp. NPDC057743]|uniref:hypothetical protein n=1 Tax=Streptomyces sp. NPDC057743 TaxID=3346236 RepID=UPI00369F44DA